MSVRFLQFGWVLAAAVIGVALAGGFQASTIKIGTVDTVRMLDESDYGKEGQATFKKMKDSREGLLEFIDANQVQTQEQTQRIRDLSLKETLSKEEQAELERVKADVVAANKRSVELSTKANMSIEERDLVVEFARRRQTTNETAQRWFREFSNEMTTYADRRKLTGLQKARAAITEVSKTQGYTVVFDESTAPYGANDITDATLTAMNAKK